MKIKIFYCCLLLFITTVTFASAKIEIINISPPKLDEAYLGPKILCQRPMRIGAPRMEIEVVRMARRDQIIAHDYGHGGSGWTLGPGSASYVNNLLINSPYSSSLTKKSKITIIGAGVIGLFTAYDLYNKGYTNITILADKFDNLTSHNAGGLLAPVSMNNAPKIQKIIDQIGVEAYRFYELIAKGKHNDFKEGAVIIPAYFRSREESGLQSYVGVVVNPARDVVLDFNNGKTQKMVVYDEGIFIDTAKMMEGLTEYLKSKKVEFVQKKVSKFTDIDSKFVINCTGLGSFELNGDEDMVSVQGHLVMLKDQNPKDLQYMILVYFGDGKTKDGQKITRSFYMFPKKMPNTDFNDIGVIGGTFIENATTQTPNTEEFDVLVKGAKEFYGVK